MNATQTAGIAEQMVAEAQGIVERLADTAWEQVDAVDSADDAKALDVAFAALTTVEMELFAAIDRIRSARQAAAVAAGR